MHCAINLLSFKAHDGAFHRFTIKRHTGRRCSPGEAEESDAGVAWSRLMMVAFDTSVADLTGQLGDPVDASVDTVLREAAILRGDNGPAG
jgi:hypothetical protein